MATFTFDGTSSVTATKADTVIISADPQTFTQAVDNGSSVTLSFGAQSITVTGTTFVNGGLPNVFVNGGVFAYANNGNNTLTTSGGAGATGNELVILGPGTTFAQSQTTTANSKLAIFGGLGRVDSVDAADTLTIGGKGSFQVFGNGGGDTIQQTQSVAFDSTSTVSVNGDQGDDVITLAGNASSGTAGQTGFVAAAVNTKASIFVGGGAGLDSITVSNTGNTTIFGGVDSSDGADRIVFNGDSTGAAGTSTIFGNGGDDVIRVGIAADTTVGATIPGGAALDSTSTTTIYGGFGNDSISVTGTKATVSVLGGEGQDTITVNNSGNTFITGGNQSGDQSLDGADTINFTGGGTSAIFGNAGADNITAVIGNTTSVTDTSTTSIYGGKDNDTILQTIGSGVTGKASVFIAGGEGTDNITANGNGGAVTIYGGVSSSDSADGADVINYGTTATGSTGAANIYANGGADSVSIGVLGTDSANTVTVYGGAGNDTISVASQTAGQAVTGGGTTGQQIVLNGNEGSDTFSIAKGTGQTITIADFSAAGGDKLALTALGGTPGTLQVAAGNYQTLQQALDAASTASGAGTGQSKAAAVVFGGSTYVVIESGSTTGGGSATTFTASTDQAIKLTGVTDLNGLTGATTITAA